MFIESNLGLYPEEKEKKSSEYALREGHDVVCQCLHLADSPPSYTCLITASSSLAAAQLGAAGEKGRLSPEIALFFIPSTHSLDLRFEKMAEVASTVVHEVLGRRAQDVDQPIIDYIVNVLADEDFDFGEEGEGAFEAIGELLVDSGCVSDPSECRLVTG